MGKNNFKPCANTESKNLLAILGSPHKNGTTAKMLDCATKAAEGRGWSVNRIYLYDKNITFCSGCRTCITSGKCALEDDIREIETLMKDCDAVVLAAPVYWANVPAVVKNMFDRLLGTAMEETRTFPKPRLSGSQRYILLTSCNTPFPFSCLCGQSSGAIRSMKEFFRTAGMRYGGKFVCTNTSVKKELPDRLIRNIGKYWESW